MVAFIGAVICIIAAVHTGSSKVAAARQQPATENQSVYPDAAARTGAMGALHGSEAPTFKMGLSAVDGVTGLTGHDPTVSRLICTPIPAGECNPKNFQQQADDPSLYAGEDWGFLRTAAEELRQTVLQQKDQILSDQRTIRELNGKLSECEKGLGGSGSAALQRRREEAHVERIMVRDSAASASDGAHFLTARAVDELELAITQLKDRIEKLESDISPFPHNWTDSNPSEEVSGGTKRFADPGHRGGADRPWKIEDLEGELGKKVELLEKERKALRLETEKHRQEIDQGINKLHHRISGLEEGVVGHSFPEGFRLSFPSRTNYMFALVKHSIPKMHAFTACLWLRPAANEGIGTPLSYAVPEQPNELVLLQGLHTPAELIINDKVAQLPLNISHASWQHICVSWSQKEGAWKAYQGGKLKAEGRGLAVGHHIRPGGVFVLGQEQDFLSGGFESSQALVGELSQVGLWERVLSSTQVATLARCGKVTQGNVVPWTENGVGAYGGATKDPGEPCSKHNRSSK